MKTFYLEILSPERAFYSGECLSLSMPISDGMIGIMADHTPITAVILDGEVHFTKPDGEKIVCAVTKGMADVANNKVRLLCGSAIAPDEIDAEEARQLADEAAAELRKKQSQRDFAIWQSTFNSAMNQLRIKNKNSMNI